MRCGEPPGSDVSIHESMKPRSWSFATSVTTNGKINDERWMGPALLGAMDGLPVVDETIAPLSASPRRSGVVLPYHQDTENRGTSLRNKTVAAIAPASCARIKRGVSEGRMPAKVSDTDRPIVTAGFAKEVDAVNQYAEVM